MKKRPLPGCIVAIHEEDDDGIHTIGIVFEKIDNRRCIVIDCALDSKDPESKKVKTTLNFVTHFNENLEVLASSAEDLIFEAKEEMS